MSPQSMGGAQVSGQQTPFRGHPTIGGVTALFERNHLCRQRLLFGGHLAQPGQGRMDCLVGPLQLLQQGIAGHDAVVELLTQTPHALLYLQQRVRGCGRGRRRGQGRGRGQRIDGQAQGSGQGHQADANPSQRGPPHRVIAARPRPARSSRTAA